MEIKLLTDTVACEQAYHRQVAYNPNGPRVRSLQYIRLIEPIEIIGGNKILVKGILHKPTISTSWTSATLRYMAYLNFEGFLELPESAANILTTNVNWLIFTRNLSVENIYSAAKDKCNLSGRITFEPYDCLWGYKAPAAVVFENNLDGYCSAFMFLLCKYKVFGALYADSEQARRFGVYDGSFVTVENAKECLALARGFGIDNDPVASWPTKAVAIINGNMAPDKDYKKAVELILADKPKTIEDFFDIDEKFWR